MKFSISECRTVKLSTFRFLNTASFEKVRISRWWLEFVNRPHCLRFSASLGSHQTFVEISLNMHLCRLGVQAARFFACFFTGKTVFYAFHCCRTHVTLV